MADLKAKFLHSGTLPRTAMQATSVMVGIIVFVALKYNYASQGYNDRDKRDSECQTTEFLLSRTGGKHDR